MDVETLEATLGFSIRAEWIIIDGKMVRPATRAETMLWWLLVTPQQDWADVQILDVRFDTH